jgi:hypothetical protein
MERPYDKYLSGRPFLFRIQTPRAVSLTFLWAIAAAQADAFRVSVVEDFEGVAVEDRDDGAAEVGDEGRALQV